MTKEKDFFSSQGGISMSTLIYTEQKYILIHTEQKKTQQIKPKKHLNKKVKIKAIKSEKNLVDEYWHKSEPESFHDLLIRFISGFIVPL
ncbi:MAG: hypothetical protein F6K18_32640 [Okeania sp. SIO2C2]|uniref:hypothetical protein n=1 Tax=Okeania sp. SIO2C2 TaxID=2607787 RepID=UPI0013BC0412|nr:hypothetical protein [Okeania sp. SIO2C2]NEP91172.1 hypothetical protein [Okeania sp. SIO2C2]